MSRSQNKVFYFNNNKSTRKDKKTFKILSIRKLISPFLNAQNTNNRSNQFHGQTQAEYYLVGPRIILMSIVYTLNHYFIKQVIFHTNSASGMVNKMNPIPTLSSAGKCPKLY